MKKKTLSVLFLGLIWKPASGVTVLGLLVLIAVGIGTLCLAVHVGQKMLAGARRIVEQREAALGTNYEDIAQSPLSEDDLFVDIPGATWTALSNGWYLVDIPDEALQRAAVEHQEWAVWQQAELGSAWVDTGARQWGNPAFMRNYLFAWVNAEGPVAPTEAHLHRATGFFKAVPVGELP